MRQTLLSVSAIASAQRDSDLSARRIASVENAIDNINPDHHDTE